MTYQNRQRGFPSRAPFLRTVAIGSIHRRIRCLIGGLGYAGQGSRICRVGIWGAALAGLYMLASLASANLALAGDPRIDTVIFTGTNADLAVAISGKGFGTLPGCKKCAPPYLKITDGRGYGCQEFNIASWTDTAILFNGFQGNPGDNVLVIVTNPQNHLVAIKGKIIIPRTIAFAPPKIDSVSFRGAVGRDLKMTINGAGFGDSPHGFTFPFDGNLRFFSFVDTPFTFGWGAGNVVDAVTLKYESWSHNKIEIHGFGDLYGFNGWEVSRNDPVEVFVANSDTCGLAVNAKENALGATSIAAVWVGHLP
jgi:hypothetical protein